MAETWWNLDGFEWADSSTSNDCKDNHLKLNIKAKREGNAKIVLKNPHHPTCRANLRKVVLLFNGQGRFCSEPSLLSAGSESVLRPIAGRPWPFA